MRNLDIVAAVRVIAGTPFIVLGHWLHVFGVLIAAFGVGITESWQEAVDFFDQQR